MEIKPLDLNILKKLRKPKTEEQKIKISKGVKLLWEKPGFRENFTGFTGKTFTKESLQKISKKKNKGKNNKSSKWDYKILNINEDFWEFFNRKERKNIISIFCHKNKNMIKYKNFEIDRIKRIDIS